jgi:hypothetical protein
VIIMEPVISIEPGVGLRVKLDQYRPTNVFPGGPTIWGREYQSLIRDWAPASLGRFLPLALLEPDDPQSVLFVLNDEDGQEVTSKSEPIGSQTVPAEEFDEILGAVRLLRRRAESPDVADEKRKAIEAFSLPDPRLDSSFYRIYGPRWRRRLLILWGCERRTESGLRAYKTLPAEDAIAFLRENSAERNRYRWFVRAAAASLLILLAIIVLCRFFDVPICSQAGTQLYAAYERGWNFISGSEKVAITDQTLDPNGARPPTGPQTEQQQPQVGQQQPSDRLGIPPGARPPTGPQTGQQQPQVGQQQPSDRLGIPPGARPPTGPQTEQQQPQVGQQQPSDRLGIPPGARPPAGPQTGQQQSRNENPIVQPEVLNVSPASEYRPVIVSQEPMTDGKVRIVMKAVGSKDSDLPPRTIKWTISNTSVNGSQVQFLLTPRVEPYKLEFRADEQHELDVYNLSVDVSAKLNKRNQQD